MPGRPAAGGGDALGGQRPGDLRAGQAERVVVDDPGAGFLVQLVRPPVPERRVGGGRRRLPGVSSGRRATAARPGVIIAVRGFAAGQRVLANVYRLTRAWCSRSSTTC